MKQPLISYIFPWLEEKTVWQWFKDDGYDMKKIDKLNVFHLADGVTRRHFYNSLVPHLCKHLLEKLKKR